MTMLVDSVTVDQFMKKDPTWDRLVRSSTQGTNIYRDHTVEKWRYNPRRRNNRAVAEACYAKHLAGPYPRHLVIEPTNKCNASCSFCSRQKLTRPIGLMEWDTYTKIIDEAVAWPDFYSVSLYMLGEPTLHPRLRDMISYAKRMGVPYVDVSTNALNQFSYLLGSGLNEIIVSIENGSYKQAKSNLVDFIVMRAVGQHDAPLIRLQIIDALSKKTEDLTREWIDRVDVVYLKHLEGMRQALGDALVDAEKADEINKGRKQCKQLYYMLNVNWDGTVAYCCHDPEGKSIIGDVHDSSIQDLWQKSIRLKELRNEQEHGYYRGLCENCVDWGYW